MDEAVTSPGSSAGGGGVPGASGPSRGHRLPAWLRRRAAYVVAMLLVGALGGGLVATGRSADYSAHALLVVRSGTATTVPGSANDATALAVTYAALLPSDTALRRSLATRLGLTPKAVASSMSVTAETGTALIAVSYTASTAAAAIGGVNTVASLLAGRHPPGGAIIPRSIAVVGRAHAATKAAHALLTGLVAGGALGLVVGLVLLLTLERVDARVDDADDLAALCGRPSTRVPGGLSVREIAVAVARTASERQVTVVPLSAPAEVPAVRLGSLLGTWWPEAAARPAVAIAGPYSEVPWELTEGDGPTLVVVTEGTSARVVQRACERLRLLGREPLFGVLVERPSARAPGRTMSRGKRPAGSRAAADRTSSDPSGRAPRERSDEIAGSERVG